MDSDSEPKLRSLISQLLSPDNTQSEGTSLMIQIVSLVISMDIDSQPKSELMSLVSRAISIFNSMDLDSQPEPLLKLIYFFSHNTYLENSTHSESEFKSFFSESMSLEPQPKLILFICEAIDLLFSRQPKTESELIKLIDYVTFYDITEICEQVIFGSIKIIDVISSMDLDSQPKPESKLMSLVSQAISVFNSMDMDSQPAPLSELISFVSQAIPIFNSMDLDSQPEPLSELISLIIPNQITHPSDVCLPDCKDLLKSLVERTLNLKPEPELISLIHQILSLGASKSSRAKKFKSVCPRVQLRFEGGQVYEEVPLRTNNKWDCLPGNWKTFVQLFDDLFFCYGCNGENHQEHKQTPVEIKHPLHPKHSLQLVLLKNDTIRDGRRYTYRDGRSCYCCDGGIEDAFYYCSACDFAINFSCAKKSPVLSIDRPKWHEHPLALFSRTTSLTCDLCALVDSTGPLYICPPCGFVAHQRCLSLPRVIRISRHLHRLSFTHSFDRGDWSCGVCRRKIDNDYGGYSCIKEGCSYGVHSKCATQTNVWDGIELEGVPEEDEEELEPPFVRIGDGIIEHFSHQHHHLKLDENTGRDYDENKLCQACVTPIHHGNLYYCLQCDDFILHEKCANLSRKIYNLLTLVTHDIDIVNEKIRCSACPWRCTGFFYECSKEGRRRKERRCRFRLHIQCATVSEPLNHESHRHPLFLTSKPGERRRCGVCNDSRRTGIDRNRPTADETFNCIECDFSLCFACATLPQKVRYRHDKHILSLSYGEETSTHMAYWCEVCERKIDPQKLFYKCDEYCCVTLHMECLVDNVLYMKPRVWWKCRYVDLRRMIITVKARKHRMSRPFCDGCGDGKRCPYNFSFIYQETRDEYSLIHEQVLQQEEFCSVSCFTG